MLLCGSHATAILAGMGGASALLADTPLFRHDHPLYFHSAIVTKSFLRQTWTTAGYDPSFMSGYAKSVVFPASSTLPEVVMALFPSGAPNRVYKMYVFVAAAAVPVIVLAAGLLFRLNLRTVSAALILFLTYLWTDWPINYASFGMVPYLVAVPMCLLAAAVIGRFLEAGGVRSWLAMVLVSSLTLLTHLTTAMIVVAPALAAYTYAAIRKPGLSRGSHAGFWSVPFWVLAANAFWWWPGVLLAGTKGESGFVFSHVDESVLARLGRILWGEPRIEIVLVVLGVAGLIVLWRRNATHAILLGGTMAAGFWWGYLASAYQPFVFLQPGRHTFVFYSAGCLAGGILVDAVLNALASRSRALAVVVGVVMLGVFVAAFGRPLAMSVRYRTNPRDPFLSSRTPRHLEQIERWIRRSMKPGERLLYEEGGFEIPGVPDPFAGGRYSGLLPSRFGIELIGGPYLHASLTTNFTQFGENVLFGKADWDREWFVKYAQVYRPSAIICWSPHARRFCHGHPELVQIDRDDGRLLFGRILGFGGDAARGKATVIAEPGRLRVKIASSDVDGLVVLRYHFVPRLKAEPSVPIEQVFLNEDPVPFIGLRSSPRDVILRLDVSP